MDTKKQKAILQFVKGELDRLHDAKEQRLYTCHIVERKYGDDSQEAKWYNLLIRNLPNNDTDFFVELSEKINEFYSKKLKRPFTISPQMFRCGAPFDDNDYENRVLLLNYFIKKFK